MSKLLWQNFWQLLTKLGCILLIHLVTLVTLTVRSGPTHMSHRRKMSFLPKIDDEKLNAKTEFARQEISGQSYKTFYGRKLQL